MLITSRDNQRIQGFCRLRDSSRERAEKGLFVIEGARICADAVRESADIRAAFYTPSALEKYPEAVSGLIAAAGESAFEISEEVSKKLGGTVVPQGVFAEVKMPPADETAPTGKVLILDGLQDPGNIGTMLRAADATGVSRVYLCSGCDLYNPKLIRSTMGSVFRVSVCSSLSFPEVISYLHSVGYTTFAAVVDGSAEDLSSISFPELSAAVIGNEGSGLSSEDVSLCSHKMTIKMSGTIESLNAASAASIILWELTKPQ